MVARAADADDRSRMQALVHEGGAAPAVGGLEDADPDGPAVRRAAAQRVLANEAGFEHEVDVGARRPRRQRLAAGVGQGDRDDIGGDLVNRLDDEVALVLPKRGPGLRYRSPADPGGGPGCARIPGRHPDREPLDAVDEVAADPDYVTGLLDGGQPWQQCLEHDPDLEP